MKAAITDPYSKSLAWVFHPNETIRLMRALQLKPIDISVDLTPHYKDDIKVGVVIGTYGATPYIDLQLHYLKNVNGVEHVLVHDDCSPEKDRLKKLCSNYGYDFISTEKNLPHKTCIGSIGDQSCFYEGLKWAKKKGLDVLVKLSRRLIPCYKWIDDFKKLVKDSDGITFSSYCKEDLFPFRTECTGMNVDAWTCEYVLNSMKTAIDNGFIVHQEFWMGSLAKQLDWQNFSPKYEKYKKKNFTCELYSGYVHWYDLLGDNRHTADGRHKNVLWHIYTSEEEMQEALNKVFSDKYTSDELKVVEF